MNSKIMKTIDNLLPENKAEKDGIRQLDSYKLMQKDFEYLETFVNHEGIPNIVEFIEKFISNEARLIPSAELRTTMANLGCPYNFLVSCSDSYRVSPFNMSIGFDIFGIGIKSKVVDGHNEPTIYIHRFGHNMNGGLDNAKKGVYLQAYNIPREIADIVIKDFTKLEGDRNDIILGLEHSQDITECYPKDYWVNFQKGYINKGEIPHPGIDENVAYVIEKKAGNASVFGNANGFKNEKSSLTLDIRIELQNEGFQFPSERGPGFDITERSK